MIAQAEFSQAARDAPTADGPGISGRLGIYELMLINSRLREIHVQKRFDRTTSVWKP